MHLVFFEYHKIKASCNYRFIYLNCWPKTYTLFNISINTNNIKWAHPKSSVWTIPTSCTGRSWTVYVRSYHTVTATLPYTNTDCTMLSCTHWSHIITMTNHPNDVSQDTSLSHSLYLTLRKHYLIGHHKKWTLTMLVLQHVIIQIGLSNMWLLAQNSASLM